ncbi:MAG: YaaA family protein [Campylobacteraceae bacterium]|jgi:cytoplasmic iron level regulating protein YaaA (DUF328/UPF0246 family)|nr:YaaA family protein [Campylobacteraceae bacterium]
MKVLFSPSEDKSELDAHEGVLENSICFSPKFQIRKRCIDIYNQILSDKDEKELSKLFGFKNKKDIDKFAPIKFDACKMQKAVLRYTGTAYANLKYETLDKPSQDFIDENVMIFSNLFGPVLAGNFLPYYKIKQGESLRGFDMGSYYKENFESDIDKWLDGELVVDLRAGFYEKFYQPKTPHITMKFYKNGKILSHFAKVYRGLILRELSIYRPRNIEELQEINFQNLTINDIKKSGLTTEYSYSIK